MIVDWTDIRGRAFYTLGEIPPSSFCYLIDTGLECVGYVTT